jgi:hypothetical protein
LKPTPPARESKGTLEAGEDPAVLIRKRSRTVDVIGGGFIEVPCLHDLHTISQAPAEHYGTLDAHMAMPGEAPPSAEVDQIEVGSLWQGDVQVAEARGQRTSPAPGGQLGEKGPESCGDGQVLRADLWRGKGRNLTDAGQK